MFDQKVRYEDMNRAGRRGEDAIARKTPHFNRAYKARQHQDHQSKKRAEGLAYRIAKIKRDIPAIKAFQKMHKKLKKQFVLENKKIGI